MKILVCYDGSTDDETLLEMAQKHAKAFDAKVYVLTVLTGGDVDQLHNTEQAKKDLEKVQNYFQDNNISAETKMIFGDTSAGECVVDFAQEKEIDEIIIGIRKKPKIGKFFFGSTAQHVILEASCTIVTVK